MKLTQTQAAELLTKLGVQDAQIVADEAADASYNQDAAIKAVDDSRIAFHKPTIEAEVKDAANAAAAGKYGGTMRRALAKKTGVPASELEKITKDDEAIEYAFQKFGEKLGGDTAQVRAEYEKALKEWGDEKTKLEGEWEGKVKEQKDRYYDREIGGSILTGLKDAPILQTADRETVAGMVKERVARDYQVEYDEDSKAVKYIDRKTGLTARNKANTGLFDLKEYAQDILSPLGLWQKDMRHVNPAEAAAQGNNYNADGTRNEARQNADPMAAMTASVNGFIGT